MIDIVVKINRIGERNTNKFGSEMVIVEYRGCTDIDVYFPQYDWMVKNRQYSNFKIGNIKCPYERRYYVMGYLGEGKYKVSKNGKHSRIYTTWHSILVRCYSEEYHNRQSTYVNCKASEEFLNFQNFGNWDEDNYYEIEGEKMCLDKDILVKGNKIYSPETCIFVPERINLLFTRLTNRKGKLPLGVKLTTYGKYRAVYSDNRLERKDINLGVYSTPEEAFEVYKEFKEKYIKEVADEYKDKIPQKLYDAMYNYEVEITD